MSLQRKAIDGIWFPTAPLIKWKMTDHTSNHSLVGGPFVMIPMTMSQATWDSLTDEQRGIFRSMENELTNFTGAIVDNRRGSSVAKMEGRGDTIIRLSPEEKAKWVAQTKPAYDAWLALMAEKGNDGEAILAKVREFTAEFKGMDYTSADWWGRQLAGVRILLGGVAWRQSLNSLWTWHLGVLTPRRGGMPVPMSALSGNLASRCSRCDAGTGRQAS